MVNDFSPKHSASPEPLRVLMHIECLRGTGELTLARRAADALASQGVKVTVACGNPRDFFKGCHPDVQLMELPCISYNETKQAYLTSEGKPLASDPDWRRDRKEKLLEIARKTKPDAVLSCYWPFGNGHNVLDEEMEALTTHAKLHRLPVYVSIRDVLHVDSKPYAGSASATAALIKDKVDKVFVHGDEHFLPLTDDFNYASALAEKLHYTGYICSPKPSADAEKNVILISAGGGDFRPSGLVMLERAIDAVGQLPPKALAGKTVKILVGKSFTPAHFANLTQRAESLPMKAGAIEVIRTLPLNEYQALLPHCALMVGQAGIGTMMDSLAHRYPMVVVPVEDNNPSQGYHFKEQGVRAAHWAAHGAVSVITQSQLESPDGSAQLAGCMQAMLNSDASRHVLGGIQCDGAENMATAMVEQLRMHKKTRGSYNAV